MLVGFSLFNYVYLLFQSLSQTNFEKHLAIYENNMTFFNNSDFLTLYYHSYDYEFNLAKIVFYSCFFLIIFFYKLNYNLTLTIQNKDKHISEIKVENEKLLNKIELLEENYNVIKNLLFEYDSKVDSKKIDEIFNMKNETVETNVSMRKKKMMTTKII